MCFIAADLIIVLWSSSSFDGLKRSENHLNLRMNRLHCWGAIQTRERIQEMRSKLVRITIPLMMVQEGGESYERVGWPVTCGGEIVREQKKLDQVISRMREEWIKKNQKEQPLSNNVGCGIFTAYSESATQ